MTTLMWETIITVGTPLMTPEGFGATLQTLGIDGTTVLCPSVEQVGVNQLLSHHPRLPPHGSPALPWSPLLLPWSPVSLWRGGVLLWGVCPPHPHLHHHHLRSQPVAG